MKTIEEISFVFNALSQENRIKIFKILVENSKEGITPSEISKQLNNIPRNTLSFHLNLMSQANLCNCKKNGKNIFYKPNCKTIKEIINFLLKDCCENDCC